MRYLFFARLCAAVLAGVLLLSACIMPRVAEPTPKRELTAQEIVDKSAEAMQDVESAHFRLEVTEGRMAVAPGIEVDVVEGDVVNPGRMRLNTTASIAGFTVEIELISVDGKQYLRNPLTQRWEALQTGFPVANLFDPERGPAQMVKNIKNLTKLTNETIDGVESYHLKGTIESAVVAAIVGGAPAGSEADIEVWIGVDDLLVRQIRLQGMALQGDTAGIIRTLKLSRFNEPVTIEPPV